jgi:2-keto-4-pentenoate hydratase
MGLIDPRLAAAFEIQLARRQAALIAGAERVGWKLGLGASERIGGQRAVGNLTSATRLESRVEYLAERDVALHADAEVALEIGRDVSPDAGPEDAFAAIAGFGTALEVVDLEGADDDPEKIVADNVFHRAYALGPLDRALPPDGVWARLIINGEVRAAGPAEQDLGELVRWVAVALGAVGERLLAGDRLITGSVVQVSVTSGDVVVAELGALGRVQLAIAS